MFNIIQMNFKLKSVNDIRKSVSIQHFIYVCVCVCVCVCIYIYIYTHIYVCVYTVHENDYIWGTESNEVVMTV